MRQKTDVKGIKRVRKELRESDRREERELEEEQYGSFRKSVTEKDM